MKPIVSLKQAGRALLAVRPGTLNPARPGLQRWYEETVWAHRQRIFGFACYYLNDPMEAEDVTQEVFIRLWEHRQDVDPDRVGAWLLRVTRNACIDAIRHRGSYRRMVESDGEVVDRTGSGEPLPDAVVEASEFGTRLESALSRIAEPYRSLLILREIQDLTYEQIGEALDLPLNTVKVYLHRARRMLRDQLREVIDYERA